MRWTWRNLDVIGTALGQHLLLVTASLLLAVVVALPLGVLVARQPLARGAVLGGAAVVYSVPTLALFALLVPLIGLGFWPSLIALASYAVPVLLRAVVTGLLGVPPAVREAADGMGLTSRQRLWQVDMPLALPSVLAGLRIAVVTLISAATVAAYISGGGLGVLILTGLDQGHTEKILVGAGLVCLLALLSDTGLRLAQRRVSA
jgi:osmoprotectant transport system permease protein